MTTPTSPVFDEAAAADAAERARRDAPIFNPREEAETIRVLQAQIREYEPARDIVPAVMAAVAEIDAADMADTVAMLREAFPDDGAETTQHVQLQGGAKKKRKGAAKGDFVATTMRVVRALAAEDAARAEKRRLFFRATIRHILQTAAVAALLLGTARMLVAPAAHTSFAQARKGPAAQVGSAMASASGSASTAKGSLSTCAVAPSRGYAAEWLLARQLPQGGWDAATLGDRPEFAPALTALGLLALQRQDPAANREAVLRGATALCAMQAPDGSFGRGEALRLNQTLVSAVLLELNQSLQSSVLGEAIAAALDFSRRAAASGDGTWGYASGHAPARHRPAAAGLFAEPAEAASPQRALRDGLRDLPHLRPAAAESFYTACLAALNLR